MLQSSVRVCRSCGSTYDGEELFCPTCKIPLSPSGDASPVSAAHARARKLKPSLTEGKLVRVAGARNQAEAEFIQGLLLEEGVPSLVRRSAGFDVPDFLAAGPRDVLVPESGVPTAREVLLQAELISDRPARAVVAPVRLLAGLMAALMVGLVVMWLVFELTR